MEANVLRRTRRTGYVLALASVLVFGAAATIWAADASPQAIQDAKSSADDAALADQYEKEAAAFRKKVAEHEAMLRNYERGPRFSKIERTRRDSMSLHCRKLIEEYTAAAERAEGLAREHRELAAIEGGGAVDHAALATRYRSEAAELRAKANMHEKMASSYRTQRYQKNKRQQGSMVSHCENLTDQFTQAADQAEALAKLHEELAKK
jgi:hypothetical protein